MPPGIAKDFDKEVGAAVDDFRVVLEIGCGIDHPEHLDDPLDTIEIPAKRVLDRRDQHETDLAGMAISRFDRHASADLTPGHRSAGALRTLAREIEQIANPLGVDVVAEGLPTFGREMLSSLSRCSMFIARSPIDGTEA